MSVRVYRIDGTLVRELDDIQYSGGVGSVFWNRLDDKGQIVPSGVYFLRVTGDVPLTQKVVVLD
jgi:flagellar hook assembly protein FlgD